MLSRMAPVLLLILLLGSFAATQQGDEAPLRSCSDSFVVHTDKIIRTQDSRALGAKYLSESEVASRADCLQLCCETPSCDVFVYEHKRLGSCYLFHCGDEQEFKCKFTEHRNYSSGLLLLSAPYSELEAQIKLTKHEHELTQLRKAAEHADITIVPTPSTTEKVPHFITKPPKKAECSRYQFECRGSGECIAIYNACDGIPQCPDGSDEGPDCPTAPATTKTIPIIQHQQQPLQITNASPAGVVQDVKKSYGPQQQIYNQQQMPNRAYAGEGVGDQFPSGQWRGYGQQLRPIPDDIYNNKENPGLPEGVDRYYNHQLADKSVYGPPGPYMNGEYPKNNGYYNGAGMPYNGPYNNWPPRQREDPRWTYPVLSQPDYYYEEGQSRGRLNRPQLEQKANKIDVENEKPKDTVSVKKVIAVDEHNADNAVTSSTTTTTVATRTTEKSTVRPVIKTTEAPKTLELVMNEDEFVIVETDGENERPRGAILSLAFGMCIAAILITLVGCRLRVVQRRLRRGAKGFAHDSDYLVNGMYL